jgi:cytochrome P460
MKKPITVKRPDGFKQGDQMTRRIVFVIFALAFLVGYLFSQKAEIPNGFQLVDKNGIIRKPTDYRDRYQVLGTWTVQSTQGGEEMHYTYASPGTSEYYRTNKKFPDGTVLVKEILGTDHGQMTTGDAHWATGVKVWFVMVKDEKHRYPNNPLWGDGWGFALYKSDAPDKQVATNYQKDCLSCHVPAKSTDWVYVQGYPVLKSPK